MASWSVREFVELLFLSVWIRLYRLYDWLRTVFFYYGNAKFRKVDRLMLAAYLFDNPYTLSRRYLQARGEVDVYAYGETPLVTMDKIARRCQLTPSDTLFELGCGRGRTCFWLRCWIGCQVVGIEYIPAFVWKAQVIAARAGVDGIEFRCEDYLTSDLSAATAIYLYASNQDDADIERLVARLTCLKPGTKVITVSFALSDYDSRFRVIDRFEADFIWGNATVFIQVF
jgi:SAM-dependent methyltransferase